MKRTAIRRFTPLRTRTRLRPRSRTNSRRGRGADPKYRAWIRTLECAVCDTAEHVEAAHTHVLDAHGLKGMGTKSPDRSAIPLCANCHRHANDSYHALTPEWRWADYHGLDLPALVGRLNAAYQMIQEARCAKMHRSAA